MSKKSKKQENKVEQTATPEATPEATPSVEEVRELRKLNAEAKKAAQVAELNHRDEFRKFFAKKREKLKLDSSMEHILWLHFLATGHAEKEKFEDGLKHFGIHN